MFPTFTDNRHGQAFAKFSELRRTYAGSGPEHFETVFRETFGNSFYRAWLDWERRHMSAL